MIPIQLILSVAQMLPNIFKAFGQDKHVDVAEKVVDAAKVLTGNDDGLSAIEAVKKDPQLLAKLEEQAKEIAIAEMSAQTEQQAQVNETIRAELVSVSMFKSGWRPMLGWCIAALFSIWTLTLIGLASHTVLAKTEKVTETMAFILQYISAMMTIWVAAFAVLGVNVHNRSKDKQTAAGVSATGLLSFLRDR